MGDRSSAGSRRDGELAAEVILVPAIATRRPSRWRRPAVIGAGSFLMLLGIPGIVLPILPGWLLIGIGLIVLAQEVRSARRLLQWLQHRFPPLARGLAAAEARLRRFSRHPDSRP